MSIKEDIMVAGVVLPIVVGLLAFILGFDRSGLVFSVFGIGFGLFITMIEMTARNTGRSRGNND